MTKNILSFLDPVVPPMQRSNLLQAALHFARRFDWANRTYTNFDSPILLLGSSRGGTTLLANIVGSHPNIFIFHERFIHGKQSYDDTFGSTEEPQALRRSFLQFISHRVKSANMRWGIKIITHIWTKGDHDRFVQVFPKIKIVFVLRDGRDVVLSLIKRSKYLSTVEECYERWIESTEIFDYLRAKAPDNLFFYHYEDLVTRPEPKVREICGFLGLPFHVSMLDHKTWPGLGSYEIAPISSDKMHKWERQPLPEVAPELRERFERALKHVGYGREPMGSTVEPPRALAP